MGKRRREKCEKEETQEGRAAVDWVPPKPLPIHIGNSAKEDVRAWRKLKLRVKPSFS